VSHKSGEVIIDSLQKFDPANTEYAGLRDHYSTSELAEIDRIRVLDPATYHPSLHEKLFASYVYSKAIMTGD
jgi:hypothetical protein